MLHLYKSHMFRIMKNPIYIIGCVIALVATFAIASGLLSFSFLSDCTRGERMVFAGAAMVLYFTIFPALFINAEYSDGVIRNRIVSGYSQKTIFESHLCAMLSCVVIMYLLYMLGGAAAGGFASSDVLLPIGILFPAIAAYAALITAISFRCRKIVALMVVCIVVFNACFNCLLFGNAIMMLLYDNSAALAAVGAVLYNINALGQWFCITGFADDYTNPGSGIQILLSLCILAGSYFFGQMGLQKRDLI